MTETRLFNMEGLTQDRFARLIENKERFGTDAEFKTNSLFEIETKAILKRISNSKMRYSDTVLDIRQTLGTDHENPIFNDLCQELALHYLECKLPWTYNHVTGWIESYPIKDGINKDGTDKETSAYLKSFGAIAKAIEREKNYNEMVTYTKHIAKNGTVRYIPKYYRLPSINAMLNMDENNTDQVERIEVLIYENNTNKFINSELCKLTQRSRATIFNTLWLLIIDSDLKHKDKLHKTMKHFILGVETDIPQATLYRHWLTIRKYLNGIDIVTTLEKLSCERSKLCREEYAELMESGNTIRLSHDTIGCGKQLHFHFMSVKHDAIERHTPAYELERLPELEKLARIREEEIKSFKRVHRVKLHKKAIDYEVRKTVYDMTHDKPCSMNGFDKYGNCEREPFKPKTHHIGEMPKHHYVSCSDKYYEKLKNGKIKEESHAKKGCYCIECATGYKVPYKTSKAEYDFKIELLARSERYDRMMTCNNVKTWDEETQTYK